MRLNRWSLSRVGALGALWFFLGCGISLNVNALALENLIAQERLTVTASIQVPESIVVGQPVTVTIEVATDRWFSKGSRIEPFAIERVVIPPLADLAINGNKKVSTASWITQTRELTLFPLSEGEFIVPEIGVFISVNTEQGVVEGVVKTPALSFSAQLPEALFGVERYVVSPQLSLAIEGGFSSDREYQVGDAVTQTVTLMAESTPSMMLPELQRIELPGISTYRKPVQLSDQSTRGLLTGKRRETVIYTLEKTGDYQLPAQSIFWWNSTENELVDLVIPAQKWSVDRSLFSSLVGFKFTGISNGAHVIGLLCFMLLFGIVAYRCRQYLTFDGIKWPKLRFVRQVFLYIYAIKVQDYARACQCLYQIHGLPHGGVDQLRNKFQARDCVPALEKLYTLSFSRTIGSQPATDELSLMEVLILLKPMNKRPALTSDVDSMFLN